MNGQMQVVQERNDCNQKKVIAVHLQNRQAQEERSSQPLVKECGDHKPVEERSHHQLAEACNSHQSAEECMNSNQMKLTFLSRSENEAFARNTVAAFALPLSPTVEEIGDIKTAVSEAVTNCIVHAYREKKGEITLCCGYEKDLLTVEVTDYGRGIDDVSLAMQPFYTTGAENERSGMGFTIMKTFTDGLTVHSEAGKGTTVIMKKRIGRADDAD